MLASLLLPLGFTLSAPPSPLVSSPSFSSNGIARALNKTTEIQQLALSNTSFQIINRLADVEAGCFPQYDPDRPQLEETTYFDCVNAAWRITAGQIDPRARKTFWAPPAESLR